MIILTWNRDHENETWPQYDDDRALLNRDDRSLLIDWTVGQRKKIHVGEACLMFTQGEKHPRGVIAYGRVAKAPETRLHYDDARAAKGDTVNWIKWEIFEMLPKNDPIPLDVLETRVPGVRWRNMYSSGYYVPAEAVRDLEDLLIEYVPWLKEFLRSS